MTDSPMVSERELVLAKRRAFVDGMYAQVEESDDPTREERFRKRAAKRYPLPKVTRPRTKTDSSGVEWRIVDEDCLEYRDLPTREWRGNAEWLDLTVERALLIADLHGCPTEDVEEGE